MKPLTLLNSPQAQLLFAVLAPLGIGLIAVLLGADANFDLHSGHLYNPYAFLMGRMHLDMAPIGIQSYFNPLLDVPYYWMSLHWPPRLAAFVMGWLQGLNFVLVLGILRNTFPSLPASDRYRLPLLLAVAGFFTANFMTEIGSTMGDAISALFPMTALLILLMRWDRLAVWSLHTAVVLLVAGFIAGLGVGLKLTTAVYALALCLSLVVVPITWPKRFGIATLFGLGVLLGLAVTGGFWYLRMWQEYGNPLFPQFSSIFPNPLTLPISVADVRYLPKSLLQALFWPVLISLDSRRVSELPVFQVIWALLYALFLVWSAQWLWRRLSRRVDRPLEPRHAYLLLYILIAFLLWMQLFSIYRYLLAIELLAPAAAFLLLTQMLGYEKGRHVAAWVLGATACIALLGSTRSWGHEHWADPLYQVDVPPIAAPATTTVLTTLEPDTYPYAWLIPFFPKEVAFVGVHLGFPESQVYRDRLHEIVRQRGGPVYVLVAAYLPPTSEDWRLWYRHIAIEQLNDWASRHDAAASEPGCLQLNRLSKKLQTHAEVRETPLPGGKVHCELFPESYGAAEAAAANRDYAERYAALLKPYDFDLDSASCTQYFARIGTGSNPYQWCRVVDTSAADPASAGK